jgi:hypothetical protein
VRPVPSAGRFEGTQRIAGRAFGSSAFRGRRSREKAPHAARRGRAAARSALRPSAQAAGSISRGIASSRVSGAREIACEASLMNARDLATRLSDLLRREHEAMAEFLLALADFDRRRAWEELGYSSLFMFLHRQLRLSKGAASYRATAAALIQRIPEVIEPLRDGRLCLSTIFEIAKVLTPENRTEVLPRFFHRSKDEARELVAELMPHERPPARTMIVPVRSAAASTPPRVAAETNSSASAQSDPSAHGDRLASRPPRCQGARTARERPTCPPPRCAVRAAHRRPVPHAPHRSSGAEPAPVTAARHRQHRSKPAPAPGSSASAAGAAARRP